MTPRLIGVVVTDRARVWNRLGFDVTDNRFTVGGVTVDTTGAGDADDDGVIGWTLRPEPPCDVDGLTHRPVTAVPARPHDNGVVALDHLVIGTSDVERTTAALEAVGLTARASRTMERGGRTSVFRFFLLGAAVLELIGPPTATSDRPARFLGLAFTTTDLEGLTSRLGPACGRPHDAVQPGRRIASVRREELGMATPVAFLTPRVSTA